MFYKIFEVIKYLFLCAMSSRDVVIPRIERLLPFQIRREQTLRFDPRQKKIVFAMVLHYMDLKDRVLIKSVILWSDQTIFSFICHIISGRQLTKLSTTSCFLLLKINFNTLWSCFVLILAFIHTNSIVTRRSPPLILFLWSYPTNIKFSRHSSLIICSKNFSCSFPIGSISLTSNPLFFQ